MMIVELPSIQLFSTKDNMFEIIARKSQLKLVNKDFPNHKKITFNQLCVYLVSMQIPSLGSDKSKEFS